MHSRITALASVMLGIVLLLAGGCEVTTDGDLAITWRFNGHADELGNDPCGALGAHRLVVELKGPEAVSDVVACDAFSSSFPLGYLQPGSTTWAFGHVTKDLARGSYDVRVFFIDRHGNELSYPEPWQGSARVSRNRTTRLDLDFAVDTGALEVGWALAGGDAACEQVDASYVALSVSTAEGAEVESVQLDCGAPDHVLLGLTPGDYSVTGQLLDDAGSPITTEVQSGAIAVAAADMSSTRLDFAWSSFTVPILGNARFELVVGNVITQCSEVDDLANGPLSTRMLLADDQGTPVAGAQAYPNPDSQLDCTDLTGGVSLDGTTLGPCQDVEQIICGLQVGSYTLSVQALDASDLLCYSADLALTVNLDVGDPSRLTLQAVADATDCWL